MESSSNPSFDIVLSCFYTILQATPPLVKDKFISNFNRQSSSSKFSIQSLDDYKLFTNLNNPEFQEKQFTRKEREIIEQQYDEIYIKMPNMDPTLNFQQRCECLQNPSLYVQVYRPEVLKRVEKRKREELKLNEQLELEDYKKERESVKPQKWPLKPQYLIVLCSQKKTFMKLNKNKKVGKLTKNILQKFNVLTAGPYGDFTKNFYLQAKNKTLDPSKSLLELNIEPETEIYVLNKKSLKGGASPSEMVQYLDLDKSLFDFDWCREFYQSDYSKHQK